MYQEINVLKNLSFDLFPALKKAQQMFISAISIVFQIANKKTMRSFKTVKGSHSMVGG
jgi:hypothetical protein